MSSSDERGRDLADDIWDDFKGSKFVDITPRDAESIARSVLDSPAMRDLLAEERAKALREAADAIDSGDVDHEELREAGVNEIATHGWSEASVIDAWDSGSVWRDWLRKRADKEADR